LGWLPVTAFLLLAIQFPAWKKSSPSLRLAKIGGIALLLSVLVLVTEKTIVSLLCWKFGVIEREMVGRTLSERVGSFLDSLSPAEKDQVERRVSRDNDNPQLKLAIDSMVRVGTYYRGTNEVIAHALSEDGMQKDKIQAQVDRTTLEAALRFYGTFDPRLLKIILIDVMRGFYPTNDQGIALTGPKSTFYSVVNIEKDPEAWKELRSLSLFDPAIAHQTLDRAFHDNFIRHWRFLPIGGWCLLFALIGVWRLARGKLSASLALVAGCIFGIGFAVHVVTCICNLAQPRYVLPLWVASLAAGCLLIAGRGGSFQLTDTEQASR